jgi:hypothetical protein
LLQVEVSASGWSFIQRSSTKCDVSECNREALLMRRSFCLKVCHVMEKICYYISVARFLTNTAASSLVMCKQAVVITSHFCQFCVLAIYIYSYDVATLTGAEEKPFHTQLLTDTQP